MAEAIRQGDIPGVQLRCRRELPARPKACWELIVSAGDQERWLCDRAIASEGGLEWTGNAEFGAGCIERVETLAESPPRRWLASLRQPEWMVTTRLEIELTRTPDGCELSVLHNGFEHLPLSLSLTVWEGYRRRWRAALESLARLAGSRPEGG